TSVLLMNGMMTLISSLVAGSKIVLTSRFTTSSATFSGITSPNNSTNNLVRSGWPSFLTGRYIIGRESPYAANDNPEPAGPDAGFVCVCACVLVVPNRLGRAGRAARARSTARRLRTLEGLEEEGMVSPLT